MNRKAILPLLLLTLQTSAFQINLSVDSDGSYFTYSWQPQNTCNSITIDSFWGATNISMTSSMSTGQLTSSVPDGILVDQLKGSKTLALAVDVKCASNSSLGTLTQNTFSLSLTNGNDLPVIVTSGLALDPSGGSASVSAPNVGPSAAITTLATTGSQSSGSGALNTSRPSESSASSRKTPIGAIVGGVVGGIALFIATGIIACVLLRRRRHPVELKTDHVDLLEGNIPNQSVQARFEPAEKQGRLAGVIQEKEEAQRQQNLLQADIQSQHTAQYQSESVSTEREAQLLQQVQALAERISDLERQQRELEDRLADEEAPPDYATTSGIS